MPELPSHGANAPEALDDDVFMGLHTGIVCHEHAAASIEHMRLFRQKMRMSERESIGARLRILKERSGMSLQDIADAMKMKRPTVQRYFKEDYRPSEPLPLGLAIELAAAMEGKGNPPIAREEILDLTGLPQVAPPAPGPDPLPYEIAEAMAETAAKIALEGREPPRDIVESIAKTLTALFQLYASEPSARRDVALTRGALSALALQFAPQGRA